MRRLRGSGSRRSQGSSCTTLDSETGHSFRCSSDGSTRSGRADRKGVRKAAGDADRKFCRRRNVSQGSIVRTFNQCGYGSKLVARIVMRYWIYDVPVPIKSALVNVPVGDPGCNAHVVRPWASTPRISALRGCGSKPGMKSEVWAKTAVSSSIMSQGSWGG